MNKYSGGLRTISAPVKLHCFLKREFIIYCIRNIPVNRWFASPLVILEIWFAKANVESRI